MYTFFSCQGIIKSFMELKSSKTSSSVKTKEPKNGSTPFVLILFNPVCAHTRLCHTTVTTWLRPHTLVPMHVCAQTRLSPDIILCPDAIIVPSFLVGSYRHSIMFKVYQFPVCILFFNLTTQTQVRSKFIHEKENWGVVYRISWYMPSGRALFSLISLDYLKRNLILKNIQNTYKLTSYTRINLWTLLGVLHLLCMIVPTWVWPRDCAHSIVPKNIRAPTRIMPRHDHAHGQP